MRVLLLLLFVTQAKAYANKITGGPGIMTRKHGAGILHKRSIHSASTVVPGASQFTQVTSERKLLELRAGASLAIPGLDPVNLFFKKHPFAAAFLVCAFKASASDLISQKSAAVKERSPINLRQNLAFFLYGGAYLGMFQEFLYNGIYPRLFGVGSGPITVIQKVAFDMLIHSPFLCLPMAYIIKALVFQQSFMDGIKRYIHDVKCNGLLTKCWQLWCPVQFMTFTIVPTQFRITFIACVSFFWLMILSAISSKSEEKKN